MGHATISPGYKPSFEGTREVYCRLKIEKSDEETLKRLKSYDPRRRWFPDWRLESGADILLLILTNPDGSGDEPISSIFNPKKHRLHPENRLPINTTGANEAPAKLHFDCTRRWIFLWQVVDCANVIRRS